MTSATGFALAPTEERLVRYSEIWAWRAEAGVVNSVTIRRPLRSLASVVRGRIRRMASGCSEST